MPSALSANPAADAQRGGELIVKLNFILNGAPVTAEAEPADRLLDVLRRQLGRKEIKEGCGVGECGACTVILNGKTVNSCITMAAQANGAELVTIEGLSRDALADVIKRCFVEAGAVQCGFCTPGMILSAYMLLRQNGNPNREEIKRGLSGNLCRCTGYLPILQAVEQAREELRASDERKNKDLTNRLSGQTGR